MSNCARCGYKGPGMWFSAGTVERPVEWCCYCVAIVAWNTHGRRIMEPEDCAHTPRCGAEGGPCFGVAMPAARSSARSGPP